MMVMVDRLLADGGRRAGEAVVRLRDDAHVGERRVVRADALLLRDQAGDRAVDLVGEEALRAHGRTEIRLRADEGARQLDGLYRGYRG